MKWFKGYIIPLTAMTIALFAATRLYRINGAFSVVVCVTGVFCIYFMTSGRLREKDNMNRFADVDIYLHQMAYSFLRKPKITQALEDTAQICSGRLSDNIARAIDELSYGYGEDVYSDALGIIENEYQCNRMKTLHKLLISVEKSGGRYSNSLGILIDDFDMWTRSVYQCQKEISRVRIDIVAGIIISMVLGAMTTMMCSMLNRFGGQQNITDSIIYQLTATAFLELCLVFFAFTQTKYVFSWNSDLRSEKQIMHDYNMAYDNSINRLTIKLLPLWIIMAFVSVLFAGMGRMIISICVILVMLIMICFPYTEKRSAKKRVIKDVYLAFTDWLKQLAIILESSPLIPAIKESFYDCSEILKEELSEFIERIEDEPSDIKPYYDFMDKFEMVDISSAVRTLYSISELDAEGIDRTINALVKRNYTMMEKQESLKNADIISVMKLSEYLPVFFVTMKMGVDMMLIVTTYL